MYDETPDTIVGVLDADRCVTAGDGHLEHLTMREGATGREETVSADGLFILIGAHPNTDWLPDEIASQ